jgi:hypothetical protein
VEEIAMSLAAENDTLATGIRRIKLVNFDKARQTRETSEEARPSSLFPPRHQSTEESSLTPATGQFHPRNVKYLGFDPRVEKPSEVMHSSAIPPSAVEPVVENVRPFAPVRDEPETLDARKTNFRDEEPIAECADYSPISNEPGEEIRYPIVEREYPVEPCQSPIRDEPEVDLRGFSPSEREAIRYRMELQEKLHRMTYGD